ncbi:MAG: hypothetical protein PHN39_00040 [Candidatus Pacebacteria bacterium]|nr:hypothetical protein [Candidatus Paceibacterota bacterium]
MKSICECCYQKAEDKYCEACGREYQDCSCDILEVKDNVRKDK